MNTKKTMAKGLTSHHQSVAFIVHGKNERRKKCWRDKHLFKIPKTRRKKRGIVRLGMPLAFSRLFEGPVLLPRVGSTGKVPTKNDE